jgi:hypothetical protein
MKNQQQKAQALVLVLEEGVVVKGFKMSIILLLLPYLLTLPFLVTNNVLLSVEYFRVLSVTGPLAPHVPARVSFHIFWFRPKTRVFRVFLPYPDPGSG